MNQSVAYLLLEATYITLSLRQVYIYMCVVVNDGSSMMSFLSSLFMHSALQLLEKKLKYLHVRGACFMVGPYERTARFLNQSAGAS